MTNKEAARLVAVLMAAYPAVSSRIDDARGKAMVTAFETLLGDLTYAQANDAITVLTQTATFMPSVAEIRACVLELAQGPRIPGGEAWGLVCKAMREKGAHRSPGKDFTFADPIITHIVNLLGWRTLCMSELPAADQKRFIELYDQLAATQRKQLQSPALAAAEQRRELRSGPTTAQDAIGGALKLIAGGGA